MVKRKYIIELDELEAIHLKQIIDAVNDGSSSVIIDLDISPEDMDRLIEMAEELPYQTTRS